MGRIAMIKATNSNTNQEKSNRVTADFSPEAYDVLSRLADALYTTKADTLRRALGVLDFLLKHKRDGWKLILENDATRERKEIVTL